MLSETHRFSPRIDAELHALLKTCRFMSARGFFYEILPLMESPKHYGRLPYDSDELAKLFGVSRQKIHIYITDLRKHRLLRITADGELYCPILWKRYISNFKHG